ncbi:MAG: PilN domain-containing protein [Bryobacterales bacterium]|jgi:Tfp pilus assembly protein PilN|nr:PilN domain-containing protein [Bryobacterales bacterium]
METIASPPLPSAPPPDAATAVGPRLPPPSWWRRLLQSGTGLAIAIHHGHLDVMVARVRPSGVRLVGWKRFENVADSPAATVGADIQRFLKQLGAAHLAAHVLLPREATIVRTVQLPGVPDKDLTAALDLQLESLHPYDAQPVAFGAMRIGKTSAVLVGICREEFLNQWLAFFTEAGIKLSSLRITTDVVRAAVRVLRTPPTGFLTRVPVSGDVDAVELYGESPARPVYSALLYAPPAQAVTRAFSELRLDATDAQPPDSGELESLLAAPETRAEAEVAREHLALYATALAAASAFPAPSVNLLAPELRKGSNWALVLPTLVLAVVVGLVGLAFWLQQGWQQREYAQRLQGEIRLLEKQVALGRRLDDEGEKLQLRLEHIRSFRQRTPDDLKALMELTTVLPDSAWVMQLELNADGATLAGESKQASDLLRLLDGSPAFTGSQFSTPLQRSADGEIFRIRTNRERAE